MARRMGLLLSIAFVLAGMGLLASIGWFYLRSHTVGNSLIHRQEAINARAQHHQGSGPGSATSAPCQSPAPSANGPRGIVEASSIGLKAPVVEGTDNSQLDVAVGHDPYSVWPGPTGTVVLNAHDVSWFSQINRLRIGSELRYVTPCQTFIYAVTGHEVVPNGSPIYDTTVPRLVLVTCYPLDALYLTPNRYVVFANLVRVLSGGTVATLPPPGVGDLATPLPAPLASSVSQRLTSTAPLGTLTLAGTPSPSWTDSLAPIHANESLLTLYFGALQIAQSRDAAVWQQIAPTVPLSETAPLPGARILGYPAAVVSTMTVVDTTVTSTSISAGVELAGVPSPGDYSLTMTAQVQGGQLVITGWTMQHT